MKTNQRKRTHEQGFTLIELLVVIGIIAILAGIVIVAINPARQFAQARNAQRESNVSTILNAIGQNMADHKGVLTNCTGTISVEPVSGATSTIGTSGVNLETCLEPYIPQGIPVDPTGGTAANTKYTISVDSVKRYQVCAPNHDEDVLGADGEQYCLKR